MTESLENCSQSAGELTENINYPLPDLTYLEEMAGGDEAFVHEIITYFLENGPHLLNLLRESALSGDQENLHFAAHKLLPQLSLTLKKLKMIINIWMICLLLSKEQ